MSAVSFLTTGYPSLIIKVVFALALWFWYFQLAKNDKNKGFWPTVLLIWAILFTFGTTFSIYTEMKDKRAKKEVNNFYSNNIRRNKSSNVPGNGLGVNTKQSKVVPDPKNNKHS